AVLNNTLAAIDRVHIGGALRGGGDQSGQVFSGGDIGPVIIEGDVRGGGTSGGPPPPPAPPVAPPEVGSRVQSGPMVSLGSVARVTIEGSLIGGGGDRSGQIVASNLPIFGGVPPHLAPATPGGMGPVEIDGDIKGGDGFQSGAVLASGRLARV